MIPSKADARVSNTATTKSPDLMVWANAQVEVVGCKVEGEAMLGGAGELRWLGVGAKVNQSFREIMLEEQVLNQKLSLTTPKKKPDRRENVLQTMMMMREAAEEMKEDESLSEELLNDLKELDEVDHLLVEDDRTKYKTP